MVIKCSLAMPAVILALAAAGCQRPAETPTRIEGASKSTVYDRVVSSGTLRCGYVTYPPGLIKDPNTGKFSGTFYETVEEAAKNLGLKVAWVEEVGWGAMVEGLNTDRYDMICSPVWPLSQRAKVADFSTPLYYGGAAVFVRKSDTRFDKDRSLINDPKVKIATIDGEVTDMIARTQFPTAQRVSLPQATDISQALLDVTTRKADVTFVESYVAFQFLKSNQDTVRDAYPGRPAVIYPNTFMFKAQSGQFKAMIDNAVSELINNGFLDAVLDRYEPAPGLFYRRALPYRTSAR